MPFAFNLLLDRQTVFEIESVHRRLATLGVAEHELVTQYGACVTLLVLGDTLHASIVAKILEWRLPELAAFEVTLGAPCIILGSPPTLSLRVPPSPALLAAHHTFFNELPEEDVHLHYRPAWWQPHLKLANVPGGERAGSALVAPLAAEWRPINGRVCALEVVRYPPTQSIWQAPLRTDHHAG